MNKKFSTLVASLLFASAFSAYAGTAASLITAPTAVEASTRATVKAVDADLSALAGWDAANVANVEGQLLSAITDNSRLFVIQNAKTTATDANSFLTFATEFKGADYTGDAKPFYWSVAVDGQIKNQAGNVLSVGGFSNFEVVPVKNNNATAVNGAFFALAVKDVEGKVSYVEYNGTVFSISAKSATDYSTNIDDAALFSPIETAFAATPTNGNVLNAELNGGFNLSITSAVKDVTISGADMFKGKLTAMKYDATGGTGSTPALVPADGATYYLKAANGDYIYFDATADAGSGQKGLFKTAKAKVLLDLAETSGDVTAYEFKVFAADNGSDAVLVEVNTNRLYIQRTGKNGVLSARSKSADADADAWAVTSLGASNMVDFNKFLTGQFYKVSYVKNGEEGKANAYKINGVLGLRFNATAASPAVEDDFVKAVDFVAEDPSTMWAPSIDGKNLVLTNRENKKVKVSLSALREVRAGVYEATIDDAKGIATNDLITITPVASVTKTDGYAVYADNVLINSAFYLGQSRRNADGDVPAYWAENHGTHQIGATVNKEEEATKWNVQLVKKSAADYNTQIDSVLVISDLVAYNATTGVTTITQDTLAVLPYVFQNRDNREYVKLNDATNLEYYICDKDNNNAKDNGNAQKFALKKKPGNTYNYVTLNVVTNAYKDKGEVTPVELINGANKVYLKNSANKGAWENIATYSDDANSLMVVDPIEAPEYRKVVAAWGDTVRIYRQEYPTEVLFEKRDNKSVVDKDTLSFLNVNNSVTGANPAIFVDTAYVNRTVNGVANTCYQYLLAVGVNKDDQAVCPYNPVHNSKEWRDQYNGGKPCADALENSAVHGRFLINLIDTAFAYKQDHLHNNPYINMVEADENLAKLSFVEGYHANDTLYITRKGGEVVKLAMDSPAFNVAKFAFRYVDNEQGSFKIQTQYKDYAANDLKSFEESASNEGYLRWVNGTVVVTGKYTNGETFNMEENYAGNPTANENAPKVAGISVVATNGAVIVKGAEGKNVVITNVLGQQVVNTTVSSSEATIAAPAGVVFVAVEGEAAVKAIVK